MACNGSSGHSPLLLSMFGTIKHQPRRPYQGCDKLPTLCQNCCAHVILLMWLSRMWALHSCCPCSSQSALPASCARCGGMHQWHELKCHNGSVWIGWIRLQSYKRSLNCTCNGRLACLGFCALNWNKFDPEPEGLTLKTRDWFSHTLPEDSISRHPAGLYT